MLGFSSVEDELSTGSDNDESIPVSLNKESDAKKERAVEESSDKPDDHRDSSDEIDRLEESGSLIRMDDTQWYAVPLSQFKTQT